MELIKNRDEEVDVEELYESLIQEVYDSPDNDEVYVFVSFDFSHLKIASLTLP